MSRPSPRGSSLTIYVDCVSPYSWFGITSLLRYRPQLLAHGVKVDIKPFFLGGAREAVGNPYQPTPKWKEAFATQDSEMTAQMLGLELRAPEVFPVLSLFAVRVATYVKDNYSSSKFEDTFLALASGYWSKGINVSTTAGITTALSPIFSASELEDILTKAVSPENKKKVINQTMEAGAFGAPWIVGVTSEGERRGWFGNDRWEQVFWWLGVPFEGVRVLEAGEGRRESKL